LDALLHRLEEGNERRSNLSAHLGVALPPSHRIGKLLGASALDLSELFLVLALGRELGPGACDRVSDLAGFARSLRARLACGGAPGLDTLAEVGRDPRADLPRALARCESVRPALRAGFAQSDASTGARLAYGLAQASDLLAPRFALFSVDVAPKLAPL